MSDVIEVNDNNFQEEVLDAKGTVLVDFWAPWCGPCRMQTPILENLAKSGQFDAKIVKLNTEEGPKIAGNFSIKAIPTIIVFKDGNEVERLVGVQTEDSLKKSIQ